jgi:hypothetical protein
VLKQRWKKILLWSLSIIVVLGVGGIFAANYAVDKLMNSMVEGFELESTETVDISSNDPSSTPEDVVAAQADSSGEGKDNSQAGVNKVETVTAVESNSANNDGTTKSSAADKTDTSGKGYTAQVSTDKAKQIQENVTVKDKADVASIVLSQLSVSDIKRLQELAAGGLTIEEKKEARSIILGKVSEEQYNELSQIAKKYGVSQGKTRDQVIAEEQGSE